jgi:hypothetical protein
MAGAAPAFSSEVYADQQFLLKLIKRFFRDLNEVVVRKGSFVSVRELVRAMETYSSERNLAPKRYP